MVSCGLTIVNEQIIFERAKLKKNGIYCFRGVTYRVQNGRATHWAFNGEILASYDNFNVCIGTYGRCVNDAKEALRAIND